MKILGPSNCWWWLEGINKHKQGIMNWIEVHNNKATNKCLCWSTGWGLINCKVCIVGMGPTLERGEGPLRTEVDIGFSACVLKLYFWTQSNTLPCPYHWFVSDFAYTIGAVKFPLLSVQNSSEKITEWDNFLMFMTLRPLFWKFISGCIRLKL